MDNQDTGATPVAAEEPRVSVSPEMDDTPAETQAEQPETTADTGTAEETTNAPEAGAGEPEQTEAAPPPKFRGSAKARIQELAAKAREREQEAAYWRGLVLQQQQTQPQAQAPAFDPTPYIGPAPTPASFAAGEYDPAYIEERAVYRLRAEQARQQVEARQHHQRTQETQLISRAHQRMETEAARLPDLPDAVAYLGKTLPGPIANAVAELMADSDHGADVAVSLAGDVALLARIVDMPPHRAAIELGKLEARVEARKQAASVSKAPPPPPTVTGQAAPPKREFLNMGDADQAAFMQRIMARG